MSKSLPTVTKTFTLKHAPEGLCNFDLISPDATFALNSTPIPALKKGELLVKGLYLSNDPSQRHWIQKGVDPSRTYATLVGEGEVMRSLGLGRVVASRSTKYPVGTYLNAVVSWQEYSTIDEDRVFNDITDPSIPLPMYLDVIGMTGLTAYIGLIVVGKVTKDDTVVISAAGGATGSMCVQIAKHLIGCKRIIAITGGAEKCTYVESIGADVAVDYRDPNFNANLEAAIGGPNRVDVYFDSVGGAILDRMLGIVKPHGRILACGAVAGYNDTQALKITNWSQIITNRLNVLGFLVLDHLDVFPEGTAKISEAIRAGKIKYDSSSFTLVDVTNDFSKIPEAWGLLFSDRKGPGKLLTKIGNDD